MLPKTGRYTVIEQFLADGFRYMFGNPGTVEQGFLDALVHYPDLCYILTLQESVAVLTADGYARATNGPALVQVHSTPGVGNAIGALYQAKRGHSPLVVIGGDAGIRYQNMDAQMAGDLVAMMEPVTKWATMAQDPQSLLRVLRRAVKVAMTPPRGPVYICLPMDVLDAPAAGKVFAALIPDTRTIPDDVVLQHLAQRLALAQNPLVLVGDGVAFSEATLELTAIAEALGATVYEADAGEVVMDHSHPLYAGATGHMFGYDSLPITSAADAVLIVGTYVLPEVFPELGDIFAPDAFVAHIDLDAAAIGKNHRVDVGVVSDPKRTLAALTPYLTAAQTDTQKADAVVRTTRSGSSKQAKEAAQRVADATAAEDASTMTMTRFAAELCKRIPEDAILFDEALTNTPPLLRYLPPSLPKQHFLTRGGSLGVGFPGAVGVKLAYPDRLVIGFSGDGGTMFTPQVLWTAVRHKIAAKFVVCNNASYKLLQLNIDAYWREREIPEHDFPLPFDLSQPPIRFDLLAQGMGMPSVRVETPEQIVPAIEQMLAEPGAFLIDLVLQGDVHPDRVGITCRQ